MAADTASGALHRYFEAANATAQGAPLPRFKRLFTRSCTACVSAYNDFASARDQGLVADGDRYRDWKIEVLKESEGTVFLRSTNDFAPVSLIDSSGQVQQEVDAWEGAQFAWTLKRQDGGWIVIQGELL